MLEAQKLFHRQRLRCDWMVRPQQADEVVKEEMPFLERLLREIGKVADGKIDLTALEPTFDLRGTGSDRAYGRPRCKLPDAAQDLRHENHLAQVRHREGERVLSALRVKGRLRTQSAFHARE